MAVSGHKTEASIRSYCKTELSAMNSHQSSPVLSFSQEEVIINSSRSDITKNFNFFNCNVNIQ